MKIVIVGLFAVALIKINVTMAAPSDKGGNDDMEKENSKAQLDMVFEQMKDLRNQLQQQQQQQYLINKLMEERERRDEKQQDQLKEQQDQLKKQQRRDEQQQEQITKIQRTRRSENETVEHLKKLVLAEIKPVIDSLSECAIGNFTWHFERRGDTFYVETKTISFGRTFSRKPKVIASVAGYHDFDWYYERWHRLEATVYSPTTTNFNLELSQAHVQLWRWINFIWIACA